MIDKTKTVIEMVSLMAEHDAAFEMRPVDESDIIDALETVINLDIVGSLNATQFFAEMQNRYSVKKQNMKNYIMLYEET